LDRRLADDSRTRSFEALVLPHLGAAWNLARWLMHNDHDAEDVVQEAMLRAHRFFDGFRGTQCRPWLLAIVRNTAFSWMEANRTTVPLAEGGEDHGAGGIAPDTPETLASRGDDRKRINAALARLPLEFREVVVLRELEDLSYRDIAQVTAVPVGTVMSRLARGRKLLGAYLAEGNEGKETVR
jgi:RNA polymerase sigma-70 factor (ECF subfamily)